MTRCSTASRRRRCAATRRPGRHGRSSRCGWRCRRRKRMGLGAMATFSGRAGLALRLSLAAAAGGPDRDGLRRAGPALDADPRLRRGERRRRLLRDPSRRGPVRRHHLRDVPRQGEGAHARPTCSTTRRTTCCSASTISTTSTSTTSGSACSTSRTRSSIRPGGRGSIPATPSWVDRAGRFRSLGDGQVDFGAVFSKLTAYDFDGWAVVEWECALKHPEDGAREGAEFVRHHIIRVTEKAFDDFAAGGTDAAANRRILGLG